jgi:hypothetical protein
MFRFTIRDVLWLMVVVGMGTVVVIQNWPTGGRHLSRKEFAVYAAALRYVLSHADGVPFLSIAGQDAPGNLNGAVFRPSSRAAVTDAKATEPIHPTKPRKRVRDLITGEPGTIIELEIIKWLGPDRVRVKYSAYVSPDWGGGAIMILRLTKGAWCLEHEDEHWAS